MSPIFLPSEFANVLHGVLRRRDAALKEAWYTSAEYTRRFLSSDDSVIADVANELKLKYWPEYLKIDAVLYDHVNNADVVYIAIEHESNANSSRWEANKLSLLNVPLKVLVTYPKRISDAEGLLTEYARILRAVDLFDDFRSLRRQLVVFGSWNPTTDSIVWDYFEYGINDFKRIEVGHITHAD